MKIIKLKQGKISAEQIRLVLDYLRQGKIIVYPTDTVYGLGCDAGNRQAVEKIIRMKQRNKDKGLIILIKSYCALHDYCRVWARQEKYIRSRWPATTREAHNLREKNRKPPVTFILPGRNNLAKKVYGPGGSLAVRLPFNSVSLPKKEFLITMLRGVARPLVSTSLNLSGSQARRNVYRLDKYFKKYRPDLVIDAGAIRGLKPSKVIDIRDMDSIKVVRK